MSQENLDQPHPFSDEDRELAREIQEGRELRKRFYEQLNGSLKALFSHCEWRITRHENAMTELFVRCPTMVIYKRLYEKVITIQSRLEKTVIVKHTKFILYCPQDPDAWYENEITCSDWIRTNNYRTIWDLDYPEDYF
ncbi:MAG: hypothetical protein N3E45_06340 [Oscillatoriaceae bacterium SKW80]|nr:hypothetical protein [Oscillatoriaceae bacterium SKYG93]MCX8120435.1 hypothetical protein [Oscillatoriaceae bacterium SKW80]MDW8452990.1 hypothetical protein [Oscillatoriaceae cyanobacterium SKYGB_i_bin93]HIK28587.1 hypothetical protein [Oscillatoriaceae cyanobacterium M7585_C2015_266]